MTMHNYILDEQGNPVIEHDLLVWARWFENIENRIVGNSYFGDGRAIHVFTVFLATSYTSNRLDDDREMLYGTMVFADDLVLEQLQRLSETDGRSLIGRFFDDDPEIQVYYAVRAEAEQGHKTMCEFVETCLSNRLVTLPENANPKIG